MARVRGIEGNVAKALEERWQVASVAAGSVESPTGLESAAVSWSDAVVPGTAASAILGGRAQTFADARDYDADDWWYRTTLPAPLADATDTLRFEGLATIADVWIDGEHRLRSNNMFVEHEVAVARRAGVASTIEIRFHSLTNALKARRPRPRWRAQIVAQQQLRWFRTTLLGRIPAWSPPLAPVGPWRPITLESRSRLEVESANVRARVEGADGVVDASLRLRVLDRARIEAITLEVGEHRESLAFERGADGEVTARGIARMPGVARWWPHTHGEQPLHTTRVIVHTSAGDVAVDLGKTGFRSLDVDRTNGAFGIRVNGVDIFCRGACWTPLDVTSLGATKDEYRAALLGFRGAGMNMIRVGGTMVYESDEFFALADELGILIWHDFMFANMDYPIADPELAASIRTEATQFLDRVQLAPSLAVLCGGSEVEQQAAMMGLPRAEWTSALFSELLPSIVNELRPDVAYVASTPTGGELPFQVDTGITHYYGVGAYMRPFDDARRAGVRFTSECLAFANIPCDETIEAFMGDGQAPPNHPVWKARVPRDKGTGWDFDDVRDHYVGQLFDVDATSLRYADVARYLALGRVATGEAMAACMSEWRRNDSSCCGALVWFLRDLWPGAGWGVVDALGRPKAAYHFLKRALQPIGLFAIDEGLNGLALPRGQRDAAGHRRQSFDSALYSATATCAVRGRRHQASCRRSRRRRNERRGDPRPLPRRELRLPLRPARPRTSSRSRRSSTSRPVTCSPTHLHMPGSLPRIVARAGDVGLQAHAESIDAGSWRVVVRARGPRLRRRRRCSRLRRGRRLLPRRARR